MSQDNYYRVLLYVAIALLFTQFFVVAWFIGTHSLPWWAFLALTLGTGFSSSGSLLIGHELGHKPSRADRVAAQVVNGLVGYGHFCIEHNRGHHVHVATPEDSRQRAHGRVDLQVRAARDSRRVPPRLGARDGAPGEGAASASGRSSNEILMLLAADGCHRGRAAGDRSAGSWCRSW